MSEVTDAINSAEASLEQAKHQLEAQYQLEAQSANRAPEPTAGNAVFFLPPHVGDTVQFPNGERVTMGTSVSREEFDAIRAELQRLQARIADFNQRSGQRI